MPGEARLWRLNDTAEVAINAVAKVCSKPGADIVCLVALALTVRLVCFVGIGYNDDSYYLEYSSTVLKGAQYDPPRMVSWGTRIAVFLPVALFWKAFGTNDLSTSAYFLICSVGSVVMAYGLGRKLFNKQAGFLAGLLLSFFPVNVIYSTQVGPDVPFNFFYLAALLLLLCFFSRNQLEVDNQGRLIASAAGLCVAILYLIKSTMVLVFPLIALIPVHLAVTRNKLERRVHSLGFYASAATYFLLGALLGYTLAQIYFHSLTGDWFAIERIRAYAHTHDLNSNMDMSLYPLAMVNMSRHLYEWIHNVPAYGFMYIAFFCSTLVVFARKKDVRGGLFVLLWSYGFLFFFQYVLYFYATYIAGTYVIQPRHLRFLVVVSAPVCLLLAFVIRTNLLASNRKALGWLGFIVVIFLVSSSCYYSYAGACFIRNGMRDIGEVAKFLYSCEDKPVYLPEGWNVSKFRYFYGYDDTKLKNIVIYSCDTYDCRNGSKDLGLDIADAFVVTDLSPYSYINRDKDYPEFSRNPPRHWILLKRIQIENRGLFARYDPKIYYAPPRDSVSQNEYVRLTGQYENNSIESPHS